QFRLDPLDVGIVSGDDLLGGELRFAGLGEYLHRLGLFGELGCLGSILGRFRSSALPGVARLGLALLGVGCRRLLVLAGAGNGARDARDHADHAANRAAQDAADRTGGLVAFARPLLDALDQALRVNRTRGA